MSDEPTEVETPRSKPDGSAYEAHMERLTARNDATRKAGKARRKAREEVEDRGRREVAARQDANLREGSGHAQPRSMG